MSTYPHKTVAEAWLQVALALSIEIFENRPLTRPRISSQLKLS